jgi:hypothetical protein
MASNPPTVRDGRRGRWPSSRRRGITLAFSAASVTAGGVGGGYLAGIRLTRLGHLMHLSLPHDALLLLIITAGIAIVVLGRYVITYLDRRDERHHEYLDRRDERRHETISRMQNQESFYQKYEDDSAAYERRPVAATTHSERSSRQQSRSRPPAEKNGHGNAASLDRSQQVVSGALPGCVTDRAPSRPGTAATGELPMARALTDGQSAEPQSPRPGGAGRVRSRRRRL